MLSGDYSRHVSEEERSENFKPPSGNFAKYGMPKSWHATEEIETKYHLWVISKRRMTMEKVRYSLIYS